MSMLGKRPPNNGRVSFLLVLDGVGQLQVPSLASVFIIFLSSLSCRALLVPYLMNSCKFHAARSLAQIKVVY